MTMMSCSLIHLALIAARENADTEFLHTIAIDVIESEATVVYPRMGKKCLIIILTTLEFRQSCHKILNFFGIIYK
jgi:hypothetical protein